MLLVECLAVGFKRERIEVKGVCAGRERERRSLLGYAAPDAVGAGDAKFGKIGEIRANRPVIIVRYVPEISMSLRFI
jgi:hypothetical protein